MKKTALLFVLKSGVSFFLVYFIFLKSIEHAWVVSIIDLVIAGGLYFGSKKIKTTPIQWNKDRALYGFLAITSIITLLSVFAIIFLLHNPIYYADEWRHFRDYLFRYNLQESIFNRQNGHLMWIPNAILLFNYFILDGQELWLVLFSLLVNALYAFIFIKCAWNFMPLDLPKYKKGTVVLITLLFFFWLINSANLWWGLHLHNHLVILGMIIAAWGLSRIEEQGLKKSLTIFFLGAIISSTSHTFGVATWGLSVVTFFLLGINRKKGGVAFMLILILVIGGALLAVGDYALKYLSIFTANFSIINLIEPILVFLGMPFSFFLYDFVLLQYRWNIALLMGGIGLLLFIFFIICFYDRNNKKTQQLNSNYLFLLLVAFFVLGCSILVTIGRYNGEMASFFAERYIGWAILFWISLFSLTIYEISIQNNQYLRNIGLRFIFSITLLGVLTTNLVRLIARLHEYNYMTRSKVDLIVQPDGEGEEKWLWQRNLNRPFFQETVLQVSDKLRKDRKDIFSQKWAHWINQPFNTLFKIKSNTSLYGQVHLIKIPEQKDQVLEASIWTKSHFGLLPHYLVFVSNNTIVGLAVPYAYRKSEKNPAPKQLSNLFGCLPYPFSRLPGVSNYFYGELNEAISIKKDNNAIEVYGIYQNSKAIKITF